MSRHTRALAVLAAAASLLAGACSNSQGRDAGQPMRLEIVQGTAHIESGSGTRKVDGSDKVAVGNRILLSDKGVAELTLADGVVFELSGARVTVDSRRQLRLDRGKALAVAAGPVVVKSGPISVLSNAGTFRVDRTLSTRVAVYDKKVRIDGPGSVLPVDTYYEAVVPAGILPRSTTPLQIDPSDRWDVRFLKDAIDVDARLANLSRGLEAQLAAGSGPEFYRRVLPTGFQVGLLSPLASSRKTDVLIGSLIAYEAGKKGKDASPVLDEVFGMWHQGASWGLVAHRFDVAQSVLFSLLLDSVNRAGLVEEGRGPALASGPRRKASASPKATSSPKAPSPSPRTEPSTAPSPEPSPTTNVLDPVEHLLDEVVEDLLGELLPPASNGGGENKPLVPGLGG
jgi:hypothetical protein